MATDLNLNLIINFKLMKAIKHNYLNFTTASKCFAVLPILALTTMILIMFYLSWPAIEKFGFKFLIDDTWNPVTSQFGGLSSICGTLATTLIAIIIAVPISLTIAIFINQIVSKKIAVIFSRSIELMAGIPSII